MMHLDRYFTFIQREIDGQKASKREGKSEKEKGGQRYAWSSRAHVKTEAKASAKSSSI